MIVDMNAWTGFWGTTPISYHIAQVRTMLRKVGVERMFISPMHAVWCQNPHLCNDLVYQAAEQYEDVDPVPVLDPTIPGWRDELYRAVRAPRRRWVKLVPAYMGYKLSEIGEIFDELACCGLGAIVQLRMEDLRRQHPLALVADTPVEAVIDAARRHVDVDFVIGGGRLNELQEATGALHTCSNLYAEISQVDGIWGVQPLVEAGVVKKLLFGTNAPFFVPLTGIARVIHDLVDQDLQLLFFKNTQKLCQSTGYLNCAD